MPGRSRAPASQSGSYQTPAASNQLNPVYEVNQPTEDQRAQVKPASVQDPASHPYFPVFQARIVEVFAKAQVPPVQSPQRIAADAWAKICQAMLDSAPSMNDPATYSNFEKGWVDMKSPGFKAAISSFEPVVTELAKYSESLFAQASSFGFWSKPDGRLLSERSCDMTLESSGIGALFEKIPTLDASAAGWDPELWGALSAGYAQSVANAIGSDPDKQVHVCLGSGARADNIWGAVESETLRTGLADAGLQASDFVTFHGAAPTDRSRTTLDTTKVSSAGLEGAVYSGSDRQAALDAAQAHFDSLPAATK